MSSSEEEEVNTDLATSVGNTTTAATQDTNHEVAVDDARKRYLGVLDMMRNTKRARESLSASVTVSSSGGTMVRLIIESFKINERSPDAPVSVTGWITSDVSIPHEPYKFEPMFKDMVKKPNYNFTAGTLLNVSVFMKETSKRDKLAPFQALLLNGLSFNISVSFKRQDIKGLDESGSGDGKVLLWDIGDQYASFTAKECAFIPMDSTQIMEVLGKAYIGDPKLCPNYEILAYPEGVERIKIAMKPSKNKPEEEILVLHPNTISNEILLSRQYSKAGIVFHVRNLTYLDENFSVNGPNGVCQAVCSVPNEVSMEIAKSEIAFKKQGKDDVFLCIRGKGKKNTQSIWLKNGAIGLCQSAFYQEEVNKLGVFNYEIAKNCMTTIMTYLDALVFVEFDKSAKPLETVEYAFICVGIGKFLHVNYLSTFSNAGLEVGIEFAYDTLLSFDSKKSIHVRGIKSEFSAGDENYKRYKSTPEDPPAVLCLNAYTGEFKHDLHPNAWRVFAVPPSEAYPYDKHFSETDEDPMSIQEIMAMQKFASQTDLEVNQKFIKELWAPYLKRITFFAVRV